MNWQRTIRQNGIFQIAEFMMIYMMFMMARITPRKMGYRVSRMLGSLVYCILPSRRKIALDNLQAVFFGKKNDREIRAIARKSCCSLVASWFETAKFLFTDMPGTMGCIGESGTWRDSYRKAKNIHEQSGGCIFVTPHIGNWELLPFLGAQAGIPAVTIVRPMPNKYLSRWLSGHRHASGQTFIARTNSMSILQLSLRRGKSIAMLPDQRTMKALSIDYLGRAAVTTPIPAILSIRYQRPIVVVACCRSSDASHFEISVNDPIWPVPEASERDEIVRLTEVMNREMGAIVERYPEQYLWMHNRWKKYSSKTEMALNG
jgi:Kdo2-lipid IVA lauroyltransferase/acyltransferase